MFRGRRGSTGRLHLRKPAPGAGFRRPGASQEIEPLRLLSPLVRAGRTPRTAYVENEDGGAGALEARRPAATISATPPARSSRPTTTRPIPTPKNQPTFAPTSASRTTRRVASAFIATIVHCPPSTSQVTAWRPDPSVDATQNRSAEGGRRGAPPRLSRY